MNEFPIDDLRDMADEMNSTPDQHERRELNEAARHQLDAHSHKLVEGIKQQAITDRVTNAMKSVGEQVAEALKAFLPEDPNPVKGQFAGAPRMSRKLSAREIRRANGNFENAAGHNSRFTPVHLVGERYFDGGVVLYPSPRAPKRPTVGRVS